MSSPGVILYVYAKSWHKLNSGIMKNIPYPAGQTSDRMIIPAIFLLLQLVFIPVQAHREVRNDPDSSVSDSITVIPLSSIAMEQNRDLEMIRNTGNSLYPESRMTEIRNDIDSLLKSVNMLKNDSRNDNIRNLNYTQLEGLRREWIQLQSRLKREQDLLSTRVDLYSDQQDRLAQKKEQWERTLKSVGDKNISGLISEQAGEVISGMQDIDKKINGEIEFDLRQLNKLAPALAIVEDNIQRIGQYYAAFRSDTAKIEYPPLWSSLKSSGTENISGTFNKNVFSEYRGLYRSFYHNYREEIAIQESLFVIFLVFFITIYYMLRGKSLENRGKEYMLDKISIFKDPVTITFLFTFFLSYFLYSNAPPIIQQTMAISILIPFVILVRKVIPAGLKKYVYLLLAAAFAVRLWEIFSVINFVSRMILSGLTVYSVILVLWAIRKKGWIRNHENQQVRFWGMLVCIGSTALLFMSFVANLTGSVQLAELLGFGVIKALVNIFMVYLMFIITMTATMLILQSKWFNSYYLFRKYSQNIHNTLHNIYRLVFVVLWGYFTLTVFNVWDTTLAWILLIVDKKIEIGNFAFTFANIVIFMVVLWLSMIISRIIRAVLEDEVLPRFSMERGLPTTISTLVRYAIITIGFLVAVSAAGINVDKLAILFGALGVGIGFGLQNIFNNLVSGLILMFERPIHIDDMVEVGSLLGRVKSIGFRSSRIRTIQGAEVIVPNGSLISNEVVNWTLSDRQRRLEIMVGVAYGSDVNKTRDILLRTMKEHKDILKEPEPLVFFKEFGNSSLDFQMLFWAENFMDSLRIRSEVIFSVYAALNEAGIEIPFPQRDLHLRSVDDSLFHKIAEKGPSEPDR